MNEITERDLLDFALLTDFESFLKHSMLTLNPGMPFLPNWHIRAIAYQLERVRRGEINRLIINMPPRHLKSITVSVAFPAFVLGHDPRQRIFSISYGSELSLKHARDFRSIVESPWYARAFSQMRLSRSLDDEATTTLKGFRKATSVGGVLTGLGGNMIILDDPQKPVDAQSKVRRDSLNQWFSNTLVSRLDNKETGAIIVVTQRVHMDDLSGHLMGSSDQWEVLSLPAIAEVDEQVPIGDDEFHTRRAGTALHPEHESLETLRGLQKDLGSYDFGAQYQQAPIPEGGATVLRNWLCWYDRPPERTTKTKVLLSIDAASKDGPQNSYSAFSAWQVQDGHYYLLNMERGRYNFPQLRDKALALAQRYEPTLIVIEDASAGIALAQELRSMGRHRVKAVPVERDKETRLFIQTSKFEAGHVHFPKDAPFIPDLLAELLAFPHGKHDDQVDSMSQALAHKFSGYTLDNLH
ncbi:phage terminase large subunit [Methyloceanibacter caenitepidi]|uniref:Phage-related protein n=1 Tax=Methyloceanibacter caenitepidi TaxID=1384459 RepID=A0A0A8K1E6_9HYPH|nr:phage terminase large subunit [Methyloceanibacter caenitepidi]BAQ16626.1 phage-related protein [Methyloceanibacter caenitepidi]